MTFVCDLCPHLFFDVFDKGVAWSHTVERTRFISLRLYPSFVPLRGVHMQAVSEWFMRHLTLQDESAEGFFASLLHAIAAWLWRFGRKAP